ncbi:MAG: hypothetical protein K2N13_09855 [Paraprevotella sp.]|nr:hypothetical protein [Paraprevotella sp.]
MIRLCQQSSYDRRNSHHTTVATVIIRPSQQSSYDRRNSHHTTVAIAIIRLSHQLSYGCRISYSHAAAITVRDSLCTQMYDCPDCFHSYMSFT